MNCFPKQPDGHTILQTLHYAHVHMVSWKSSPVFSLVLHSCGFQLLLLKKKELFTRKHFKYIQSKQNGRMNSHIPTTQQKNAVIPLSSIPPPTCLPPLIFIVLFLWGKIYIHWNAQIFTFLTNGYTCGTHIPITIQNTAAVSDGSFASPCPPDNLCSGFSPLRGILPVPERPINGTT